MVQQSSENRWDQVLSLLQRGVNEQQFATWFRPIVFESYSAEKKTVLIRVPSYFVYEYLEEHYVHLLRKVLRTVYGEDVQLTYRVLVDKEHEKTQDVGSDATDIKPTKPAEGEKKSRRPDIDPQLNSHQTFENFIEGDSNKLARSVGLSIAEHPKKHQFNPLFIYGPSGCGKTHLINAVGVKTKQLYPQTRVLYVSARQFQVQYSDAQFTNNNVNDFIHFYQTIDMLIVDDVQEWEGKTRTLNTFFHIFDHLIRNGKRVVLASDRPPVEMKDIPERMLTRFAGGIITEMSAPNIDLCIEILNSKIRHDGLDIKPDVVRYIAESAHGSVRDLQGIVNSLMAYSVVYGCDIDVKMAQTVIKRAVKVDNSPLTVDEIVEIVGKHYGVDARTVNGKSRKREVVLARQLSMYFAQKYTHMPASRIGKLIGKRDHSTVLHSIAKIEDRIRLESKFREEVVEIEAQFRIKNME